MKKAHGSTKANDEAHLSSKRHPPSSEFGERPPHLSRMNELLLEKHLADRSMPRLKAEDDVKVYSLQETHDRLLERLGMNKQKTHDNPDAVPEEEPFENWRTFYDEHLVQLGAELGDDEYDPESIARITRMQQGWSAIKLEACTFCKVKRESAPPHVDPTTIRCQHCIGLGDKKPIETESACAPKGKKPKLEVIVEVHRNPSDDEAKLKTPPKGDRFHPYSIKYVEKPSTTSTSSNLPNNDDGPPTLYPSVGLSPPLQNHASPPTLYRSVGVSPSGSANAPMQQVRVSTNSAPQTYDLNGAHQAMPPNLGCSDGGTVAHQQYVNNTGMATANLVQSSAVNNVATAQTSPQAALIKARIQQQIASRSSTVPTMGTYVNTGNHPGMNASTLQQQQVLTRNIHTSLSGSNSSSEQPKNVYRVAGTLLHPQPLAKHKEMEKAQAAATTAVIKSTHPQPLKVAQSVIAMPLVRSTSKVAKLDQSIIATPLAGTTSKATIAVTTPAPPQHITIPKHSSTLTGQTSPNTKATPVNQPLVLLMQQPNGTVLVQQLPQGLTSPTTRNTTGQAPGLPSPSLPTAVSQQNIKQKMVSPGATIQKFISIPASSPPPSQTAKIQHGVNLVKVPQEQNHKQEVKVNGTEHLVQKSGTTNMLVVGNNGNVIQTKLNGIDHLQTSAMDNKNYPEPILLTTVPAQAIPASAKAQPIPTTVQAAKARLPEHGNNEKSTVAHQQPMEIRATINDLINAADTVECGNEVANLTQVGF